MSFVVFAIALSKSTFGADQPVELGKLVQECQRLENDGGRLQIIWWIPTEYWRESFRQADMTEEQRNSTLDALDQCTIVAIIDGKLSGFGSSKWRSADDIRKMISIELADGETVAPLATDETSKYANSTSDDETHNRKNAGRRRHRTGDG